MTPYQPYHDFYLNDEAALHFFVEWLKSLLWIAITLTAVVVLVSYVLYALSFYRLAKSRGMKHPGLAWIPFVGNYLYGAVVDDIGRYHSTQSKHRIFFLISTIVAELSAVTMMVYVYLFVFQMFEMIPYLEYGGFTPEIEQWMNSMLLMLVVSMVGGLISLGNIVYRKVLAYRIFRDYDPRNKVLYIVLAVLFSLAEPIILLIVSRKKPVSLGSASQQPRSNGYGNPDWNRQNPGWNQSPNQSWNQNQAPGWNQPPSQPQNPDHGWDEWN